MKCKECGSNMYLDDKDKRTRKITDYYYCCDTCQTSVIKTFIDGKPIKELWHTENGGIVKDETISCRKRNDISLTDTTFLRDSYD